MLISKRLVGLALVFHACLTGLVRAQCPDVPRVRVNAAYQNDPSGGWWWIPNEYGATGTNSANFAICAFGERRRIPMADPTILKIDSWYYVTGTSDVSALTNFAIYRSQDLVNWQPHMLAFRSRNAAGADMPNAWQNTLVGTSSGYAPTYPATDPQNASRMVNYINGVMYSEVSAPQLYIDPALPNIVWLSFTAAQGPRRTFPANCGKAQSPPLPLAPASEDPPVSCYYATMLKADFVNPGGSNQTKFFASSASEPGRYGYTLNNANGSVLYDGGAAQGKAIPCSANFSLFSCTNAPCPGFVRTGTRTYGFSCTGVAPMMALDPFVYFDPLDGNKRWMTYTWFGGLGRWEPWLPGTNLNEIENYPYAGNNVTGFAMRTNTLMDVNSTLRPIAYRYHWWFWPRQDTTDPMTVVNGIPRPQNQFGFPGAPIPGNYWLLNGVVTRNKRRWFAHLDYDMTPFALTAARLPGIAEGSAAFAHNGNTYIMYSRNFWDSSAYGIFYRKVAGRFENGFLPSPTDFTTPEHRLVTASNRGLRFGPSFGHGEVFTGPGGRLYLICHGKSQGENTNPAVDPTEISQPPYGSSFGVWYPGKGFSGRTVYFKELTFDTNGFITPLLNNNALNATDVGGFIIPAP